VGPPGQGDYGNDAEKKVQRGDRDLPAPPGYDPIYNFRPMINTFNRVWPSLVTLGAVLTIDEKMIKSAMHTGLSRRQPNKPILRLRRLGLEGQVGLSNLDRSGCEGDPYLRPPYHFGKTIAVILHLLETIGAFKTWVTVIVDQYFTSVTLMIVLFFLGMFGIGACQQNRRAWPATQIEAYEAEHGKIKEPGEVLFLFEVGVRGAIKWALASCKWFDKNEVRLLANCDEGEEIDYAMRKKGRQESLETTQPKVRKTYSDHKVGVDVIDQKDAALITDHGSKRTPWHRVHDAYCNTAMTLALEHYALVIAKYGSAETPHHEAAARLRRGALGAARAADGGRTVWRRGPERLLQPR